MVGKVEYFREGVGNGLLDVWDDIVDIGLIRPMGLIRLMGVIRLMGLMRLIAFCLKMRNSPWFSRTVSRSFSIGFLESYCTEFKNRLEGLYWCDVVVEGLGGYTQLEVAIGEAPGVGHAVDR